MGWFSEWRAQVDPNEAAEALAEAMRRGGATEAEIARETREARWDLEQQRRRAVGESGWN